MALREGKTRTDKYSKSPKGKKGGDFSKFNKKINPKARPMGKQAPKKVETNENTTINMANSGPMRLNKYIAHAGVCSRREADKLIGTGVITVNNTLVTELGFKVMPGDRVHMDGQLWV